MRALFEAYAGAAAGVAAIGAALLAGDHGSGFGGRRDYTLAIALALAVYCLVMSGFRAYQVSAKRFDWSRPNECRHIIERASRGTADPGATQRNLLVALLIAADRGQMLAEYKTERFKQCSRFFAFALICVILSALILLISHQ